MNWNVTMLLLTIMVCTWIKTTAHLCKLNEMKDPNTGQISWSLPSHERCLCDRVVALPDYLCPTDKPLWFTSDAEPLTRSENWTPDALDVLLDRSILCYADECLSRPCQNNGTCSDRLGAYTCSCHHSYIGRMCQMAIWTSWGSWTLCSATCGSGTQTRRRLCGFGLQTDKCDGIEAKQIETKPCQHGLKCPYWATWGAWTRCTDPCDITNPTGNHERYRECLDPDMVIANCPGFSSDAASCTVETCQQEIAQHGGGGGGGDDAACFASTSLIRFKTKSGGFIATKTLDQLEVGEYVESYDPHQNSTTFSEVYFITHEGDTKNFTKLRKLVYPSGDSGKNGERSIRLHPKHLVYACLTRNMNGTAQMSSMSKMGMMTAMKLRNTCFQPPALPVTAESVNVGDILWVRNSAGQFTSKPVISLSEEWSSVRHPMTFNHYIVVDDVLASVHMYDEGLYRKMTAPIRYAYNISPYITQTWGVRKLVELWDIVEKYSL